ncbi:MAG TPA: efflux RND transporter periplasmic adaptor subunit [Terrimicrobiaceae bacterium]|jgi:membrane fusion protein, multidrug efflux system|nr:efflux RND transporter periplasmic adaptor subunit [Terrimicrobiaceae bacterium]
MKLHSPSSRRRRIRAPEGNALDLVSGIVLVVVQALLCGCEEQKVVELPPPVVTVTEAVQKQVQDWDDYTGRLAPMGTVDVRPRVSGYITEVKFTDGDVVKKGQPLFLIDPRPYQAEYDRAKADVDKADAALTLAAADFERARQLRDKGVTAVGDFDQRSATYKQATGAALSARAALEAAKLNLEFCTITAPIDGRVGLANVTVGNLVSPDGKDPLATIVSTNPIYAYADVDERSLLRYVRYYLGKDKGAHEVDEVKVPIQLALQDETGFPHTGYIDFIDNRVDPSTGTIRLRGVFDFENGLLGPGLFVRVRIPSGGPYEAVLVPERSVASDQGQRYVVVLGKDNTAEIRPVGLGPLYEGMQVIKSGLKAGETVVVDGVLKVRPGQKVDPKPIAETAVLAEAAESAAK